MRQLHIIDYFLQPVEHHTPVPRGFRNGHASCSIAEELSQLLWIIVLTSSFEDVSRRIHLNSKAEGFMVIYTDKTIRGAPPVKVFVYSKTPSTIRHCV